MRAFMKGPKAAAALLLAAAIVLATAPLAAAGPAERAGESAGASAFTLLLRGGDGPNDITISYGGGEYVIGANGSVPPPDPAVTPNSCYNPPGDPTELHCPRSDILAFTLRGRGGNDTIIVQDSVTVSVIAGGGPGDDDLAGGSNTDRLSGGAGRDTLIGRAGADYLYGGRGRDVLRGGTGKDLLRGGPGFDRLFGGPGRDDELQ